MQSMPTDPVDGQPMNQCPWCGACSEDEAAGICEPAEDETGERSCPGTEWPLYQIWSGEITAAQAAATIEAEIARYESISDEEESQP